MTIKVSDVNDNAPKFELPDYQAHNVDEDIPIGTSILKVKAADADSGSNADIEYYVSDDHFTVNSKGIGKKHALKEYEQFILNTSCFCTIYDFHNFGLLFAGQCTVCLKG